MLDPTEQGQAERDALLRTIELAQGTGANVNLTWWQGPYFAGVPPEIRPCRKRAHGEFTGAERMAGFAGVIEEARRAGLDCVTHVTIQNEVNYHDIGLSCDVAESQGVYRRLYTLLDDELSARPDPLGREESLRATVDFVGGDLVDRGMAGVESTDQGDWLAYMQREMSAPLLDGYSIHVYFCPGDFAKVDRRMNGLRAQLEQLEISLPIYVTEYGVRAPTGDTEPGSLGGQNIEDTVEAGFEHAWFDALAPQYGCVGFSKWALYRTDGPERKFKDWGMIRPPKTGFAPESPTYFVTWLFNHLIDAGWSAGGLWRSRDRLALVSRFEASEGADHSLVALNRGRVVELEVSDLQPRFDYFSAIWNRQGDRKPGSIHGQGRVRSDGSGKAAVAVRRHELVALSTRPITG